MPTYRFRRKNGKEFEKVMMISELDEYRKKHPNLELCIQSTLEKHKKIRQQRTQGR